MEKVIAFSGLSFERFTQQDVSIYAPIMKRAFDSDTKIHTGKSEGGPPGYDNGDFLNNWYLHKDSTSFKISKDGKPCGALSLWIRDDNVNFLGNVFIEPELQNQGLGLIIWDFVEKTYPETIKWQTETIAFSRRNHHYYVNKLGFKIVGIKNPHSDDGERIFFMEKDMVD
ncbi:MAG: GNAT family N-acetyltransferase [Coriobacteriia bacterium]|nr:GNAT family N-acetyltransferase [Coriobacteriia bacterium]MCL2750562.1 GNAT family N-acetyltransferase [Coriobacteriia bacterium]